MKLIYLKWIDSHSPTQNGWLDRDQVHTENLVIDTVGFIIEETKENITVASQVAQAVEHEEGQIAGVITIPKFAIRKRKKLKL